MNKLINIFLLIIIFLSVFIVIKTISEDILYEDSEVFISEDFIAIKSLSASEYLELEYNYVNILFIKVNNVVIDLDTDVLWVWSDEDTIILVVDISDVGDEIEINYSHWVYDINEDYSDSFVNLVELIPIILIVLLFMGIVVYIKIRK